MTAVLRGLTAVQFDDQRFVDVVGDLDEPHVLRGHPDRRVGVLRAAVVADR